MATAVFLYSLLLGFFDQRDKYIHDLRVEEAPSLFLQIFHDLFGWQTFSIGSVTLQRIPNINDGEESGVQGNIFAFKFVGVAAAIPSFVMIIRDDKRLT